MVAPVAEVLPEADVCATRTISSSLLSKADSNFSEKSDFKFSFTLNIGHIPYNHLIWSLNKYKFPRKFFFYLNVVSTNVITWLVVKAISLGSEVEATDDLILSSEFFIDRAVDSLTLNERGADTNDSPRRKRSSISIFTLSGLLGYSYQHKEEGATADSKEVH
uniref:Uncharacterized protein n=1 Tax=Glossina austeni TaxID=7395 RepID=A0A1A9VHS8_GLOAU